MRDIKIRAWDEDRRIMVYEFGDLSDNKPKDYQLFYEEGRLFCGNYQDNGDWQEPIIMRHIGLNDSDGNPIFDGDVLSYGLFALNDTKKYGKDCWKQLPAGVNQNDISTHIATVLVSTNITELYQLQKIIKNNPDVEGVKIIGNIYQNPEMQP